MLMAVLALAAAAEPPDFDAFFKDFTEKRDHIESLQAQFTQDSISPDDQYRSMGELRFMKPRRIVFHYDDPELVYIIDMLRVYEYDPFLEQVQTFNLADEPETEALFVGFDTDTKRLREAYDIAFVSPDDVAGATVALQLTPKPVPLEDPAADGQEAEAPLYFEWVRLYLRGKDYLPVRIQVRNDAETETIIQLDEYRVNGLKAPQAVQVNLPEGTTIVEDEQIVETVGPEGKWIPRPVQVITIPPPAPAPAAAPAAAPATESPEAAPPCCPKEGEGGL
ncbi:MAG: outer membrane lipoprotein carrier protein LolA [bacterium]|nr:outer membrane lipoprotein carrier protein LolA [bacterium]